MTDNSQARDGMILSEEARRVIAQHNGADGPDVLSDEFAASVEDDTEVTPEDSDNAITDEQEAGSMDAAESDIEDAPEQEVAEESDSEPADDEPAGDDAWMQDVRYLADSYGLTEDELRNMGSREAFEKATILFDKRAFAWQQQPEQATQQPEQAAPETQDDTLPEKLDLNALKEAGWDEDVLKMAERHNAAVEALTKERDRVSKLEQQFDGFRQAQEQAAAEQFYHHFDTLVDTIDPEMFGTRFNDGKEQDLSREHFERRSRLIEATMQVSNMLAAEAEAQGKPMPPLDVVIRRARNYAFADDLMQTAKREVQEKATRQSRARRPKAPKRTATSSGAAASHKNDAPESEFEMVNRIVNDPEWQAAKHKIMENSN